MARHGGDDYAPKDRPYLNGMERDKMIIMLANRNWPHGKIAKYVGMSRRGVGMALERIAAQGYGGGRSPRE
jgi:hypothetical protein